MLDKPLTQDEQDDLARWRKTNGLRHVVNSPGWDVILEILNSYVEKEVHRLLNTDPGDREEVLATHAVAFAAQRMYSLFLEDVQSAVNTADEIPSSLIPRSPIPLDAQI